MSNLTDENYERLTHRLQELMEQVETIPFPAVRDAVFELLQGLDALHREALSRLLHRIEAEAPDLLTRLEDDFVLKTLLQLYDFLPQEEVPPGPQGDGFVPLDQVDLLEAIKYPIWIPAGRLDDLAPGTFATKTLEGLSVLFCRVGDEVFALHNACVRSILPLAPGGRLEGHMLECPWHGCRYDVRSGALLDDAGEAVQTFPIHIGDDGRFSVGFNIEPTR